MSSEKDYSVTQIPLQVLCGFCGGTGHNQYRDDDNWGEACPCCGGSGYRDMEDVKAQEVGWGEEILELPF